jgi:hypothetical protein
VVTGSAAVAFFENQEISFSNPRPTDSKMSGESRKVSKCFVTVVSGRDKTPMAKFGNMGALFPIPPEDCHPLSGS